MKNWLIFLGVGMFLVGLVALYIGVLGLTAEPCFAGNCPPSNGGNVAGFPIGLLLVIFGTILWTWGAQSTASGSTRNPLAGLGFLSVFGLSFFGIGAVMFIADRQPNVDHTTNVLTILGIVFGIVGIAAIALDFAMRRSGAADARVIATGIRGRATVLAVRDTNVTVNMNPMIALDLKIEIPGQPVTTKTVRQVISRLDVGDYRPGMVLAVAADPADPTHVVVDWANSPITDPNVAADPVTGRPMGGFGTGAPTIVTQGGGLSSNPAEVAALLRAAADQISSGGLVSHPDIASAVGNAHQWTSTGQTLPPDQIAAILRLAANNAGSATQVSSTDLAAMLRSASVAAANAADQAEAAARGASVSNTGPTAPTTT